MTAFHVRVEEAAVLFAALGLPAPSDPDSPEVAELAADMLRILGRHDKETSSELVRAG